MFSLTDLDQDESQNIAKLIKNQNYINQDNLLDNIQIIKEKFKSKYLYIHFYNDLHMSN